jgi:hypothetical protein
MDELNRRLTSVADEVLDEMTEHDLAVLRTRVHVTSRRMARRQAIGVTLAAGAVASGAVRLVTAFDSPAGDAGAGAADTNGPSTGRRDAGAAIPGTLVYLQAEPGAPLRIVTLAVGRTESYEFGVLDARDRVAVAAPDLAKVAVVRDTGELWVVRRGGDRRWVASRVATVGRHWPLWTPDGSALYVMVVGTGWRMIDPGTGTASEIHDIGGSDEPGYFAWSASGRYRAHTAQGFIVVSLGDGARVHQVSMYRQPGSAVQAVSDDGRYVATAMEAGDGGRVRGASLVLDLFSGKRISLPRLSGVVDRIFFRPGGGLLIRTANADRSRFRLHLVSPDGEEQVSAPQPFCLAGADLVAYRAGEH